MKRWMKVTVAGIAALAPMAAFAAIDSTHHDPTYMSTGGAQPKCAYCHSKTNIAAVDETAYGEVGGFCMVVCHGGTTDFAVPTSAIVPVGPGTFDYEGATYTASSVSPDPTTVSFTVSHSNLASNLVTVGDNETGLDATGWPHAAKTRIECTSCHSVHDNTNPPFLNAPMAAGTLDGVGTDFCSRCHTGGAMTAAGYAGRYSTLTTTVGAHPVEFNYNSAVASFGADAANRTGVKGGVTMRGRTIRTAPVGAMMVGITGTGINAVASVWNTGGHIMTSGAANALPEAPAATATGRVGCYSCHSAHQNAAALRSSGTWSATSLLLGSNFKNFCYGCHGGGPATTTGTTKENPGVSTEYHPVNLEDSVATFPIPMDAAYVAIPAAFRPTTSVVNGNTISGTSPYCVSCHDVHGGVAGKMALRSINNTLQVTNGKSICLACHSSSTNNAGAAADWHHPGVGGTDYSQAANGTFITTTGWYSATLADGLGDLRDGLSCPDCHVANRTAHNW